MAKLIRVETDYRFYAVELTDEQLERYNSGDEGYDEVMDEVCDDFEFTTTESVSYEGDMMMSLYEYLGRAAGGQLGSEVFRAAKSQNVPYDQQMVSTKTYSGKVMLYPRTFLQKYFG